jgi:hypothetical protein
MSQNINLFCYNVGIATIAGGATGNLFIRIPTGKDFMLDEIRTTGQVNLYITLQTSDGYLFSSSAFNVGCLANNATAQNPLKFPRAYRIKGGTEITINYNNLSGGVLTYFEIQLWGKKDDGTN